MKKKGLYGKVISGVVTLVAISGVIAFLRLNGINSVDRVIEYSRGQSDSMSKCYNDDKNCTKPFFSLFEKGKSLLNREDPGVGSLSSGGKFTPLDDLPTKETEDKEDNSNLSGEVGTLTYYQTIIDKAKITEPTKVEFNLLEWNLWRPIDPEKNPCWTSRKEYLKEASEVPVTYLGADRKPTKGKGKACKIEKGKWRDALTGESLKKDEIDVIHIIPLEVVSSLTENSWEVAKKTKYANDPLTLIAVKAEKKRKSEDILGKLPKDKAISCPLVEQYLEVVDSYSLPLTKETKNKLNKYVGICQ